MAPAAGAVEPVASQTLRPQASPTLSAFVTVVIERMPPSPPSFGLTKVPGLRVPVFASRIRDSNADEGFLALAQAPLAPLPFQVYA